MPDIFDRLVEELHQTLAGLWPEVIAPTNSSLVRGIYDCEQIEGTLPLGDIAPPYAVIEIEDWRHGDWSPDRLAWEPEVQIWYFAKAGGAASPIREKLHQLATYLAPIDAQGSPLPDPLVSAQVMEIGDISTSRSLPANQILTQNRSPVTGGRLTMRLFTEDDS